MRERKAIEGDIQKLYQSRQRIQTELNQLKENESLTKSQVADDMLTDGSTKSIKALADIRGEIGAREEALSISSLRAQELKDELADFDRAETMAKWAKIQNDLWKQYEEVKSLSIDLKNKLISLREELIKQAPVVNEAGPNNNVLAGKMSFAVDNAIRDISAIIRTNYDPLELYKP